MRKCMQMLSSLTILLAMTAVSLAGAPPVGVKRPVFTNPEPNPNLAYKKAVTESSFWREGCEGIRVVDGIFGINLYGSWQSGAKGEKPAWVMIDLERPVVFDTVRLYLAGLYGVASKPFNAFRIYAGNAPSDMQVIFQASQQEADKYVNRKVTDESVFIRFSKQNARFLKMEIEGDGKVTLGEVEVYLGDPPLRNQTTEPGDTRIRVREEITPQVLAKNDSVLVWLETAAEKVFRDDHVVASQPVNPVVEVDAARGEAESFQVVLHSEEGLKGVTWAFEDLKSESGKTISVSSLKANPVVYFYVRKPEGFQTHRLMVNGWGPLYTSIGEGFFPDLLLDSDNMDAVAGKHQPLWVTVTAPRDAEPGLYKGAMHLNMPSGEQINLTIQLRVRKFAMPRPRTMKTYANLIKESQSYIFQHLDAVKLDETTMKNIYKLCVENNFGAALMWPEPDVQWEGDNLKIDWTRFDKMASYCLEELQMPFLTIPGTFFMYHASAFKNIDYVGKDVPALSPEWLDAYEKVTAEWGKHLKEKGWDDRFGFYIGNEVQSFNKPEVVDKAADLLRRARKVAPNLIYIWHSGPLDPPGLQEADVFVFNPRRTPMSLLQKRHEAGKVNFSYVNYSKCTNSPTMACRGTGWILFKHRISGYTLHATAQDWAGSDPHRFLNEANGTFFFPPWKYGGEFMNSVRLAMFRDGFDDYEYLTMLEQEMLAAKADPSKAAAVAEAEAVLADARAFAGDYGFPGSVPPELDHVGRLAWGNEIIDSGEPAFDHREDPELLMAIRKRAADAIEALME